MTKIGGLHFVPATTSWQLILLFTHRGKELFFTNKIKVLRLTAMALPPLPGGEGGWGGEGRFREI